MATISYKADKTADGTGGNDVWTPAPRGVYTLEIKKVSDGEVTKGGKNPGTPITKMVLEIADEGEYLGRKVWHNVVWIERGSGDEPAGGHGMAVHFLHAVGFPFDGEFQFEEDHFVGQKFRALLGVDTYDKVGRDGNTYTNGKNTIEDIYTEDHPEPKKMPEPRKPKAEKQRSAAKKACEDEVPF